MGCPLMHAEDEFVGSAVDNSGKVLLSSVELISEPLVLADSGLTVALEEISTQNGPPKEN